MHFIFKGLGYFSSAPRGMPYACFEVEETGFRFCLDIKQSAFIPAAGALGPRIRPEIVKMFCHSEIKNIINAHLNSLCAANNEAIGAYNKLLTGNDFSIRDIYLGKNIFVQTQNYIDCEKENYFSLYKSNKSTIQTITKDIQESQMPHKTNQAPLIYAIVDEFLTVQRKWTAKSIMEAVGVNSAVYNSYKSSGKPLSDRNTILILNFLRQQESDITFPDDVNDFFENEKDKHLQNNTPTTHVKASIISSTESLPTIQRKNEDGTNAETVTMNPTLSSNASLKPLPTIQQAKNLTAFELTELLLVDCESGQIAAADYARLRIFKGAIDACAALVQAKLDDENIKEPQASKSLEAQEVDNPIGLVFAIGQAIQAKNLSRPRLIQIKGTLDGCLYSVEELIKQKSTQPMPT